MRIFKRNPLCVWIQVCSPLPLAPLVVWETSLHRHALPTSPAPCPAAAQRPAATWPITHPAHYSRVTRRCSSQRRHAAASCRRLCPAQGTLSPPPACGPGAEWKHQSPKVADLCPLLQFQKRAGSCCPMAVRKRNRKPQSQPPAAPLPRRLPPWPAMPALVARALHPQPGSGHPILHIRCSAARRCGWCRIHQGSQRRQSRQRRQRAHASAKKRRHCHCRLNHGTAEKQVTQVETMTSLAVKKSCLGMHSCVCCGVKANDPLPSGSVASFQALAAHRRRLAGK